NPYYFIRRQAGSISLFGNAGSTSDGLTRESLAAGTTAPVLLWFALAGAVPADVPGADYTFFGNPDSMCGVQQASFKNRWFAGMGSHNLYAYRHGPDAPSATITWLPFQLTYPARPINTYTGPGFVPPVLDPH